MTIAYCISCLYNPGGMERVLSLKANYLVEKLGYEVTIITISQFGKPIYYQLNEAIKVVHLDIHETIYHPSKSYIKRQSINRINSKKHKQQLSSFLLENKFDFCITLIDGHEFFFLNDIKDGSVKVAEFHFSSIIYTFAIESARGIRKRHRELVFKRFIDAAKQYSKFIVLTKDDSETLSRYTPNVMTIANPLSFSVSDNEVIKHDNKSVLGVGRLVDIKRFDLLIDAWALVNEKHQDWELNIYGSGPLEHELNAHILEKGLENSVEIHKPVSDIAEVYKNSSLFVLSSKSEGMSMALLESMAFGLAAVSFNCKNGPLELIDDGKSGFLIDLFDVELMAEKISYLIEHDVIRKQMGLVAKERSKKYELTTIMEKWDGMFKKLKEDNV